MIDGTMITNWESFHDHFVRTIQATLLCRSA